MKSPKSPNIIIKYRNLHTIYHILTTRSNHMQEVLNRIENLENQVAKIKLALAEIIQQSSEGEKRNLENYKNLTEIVEMLSTQLENLLITNRKE